MLSWPYNHAWHTMLAPVLRRFAAAGAAPSAACIRMARQPMQPLGVSASAAPAVRLFAAGPAPKQKSSKMRKKLRNGTGCTTYAAPSASLPPSDGALSAGRMAHCVPNNARCIVHAAGQRARSPTLKAVKPQACPRCGVLKLPHTYSCASCRR